MNNKIGYLYCTCTILLVSVAQLIMKWGLIQISVDLYSQWKPLFWIFSGLIAYGLSMIFWLYALEKLPMSKAYPLLSLSYIFVYLIANTNSDFGDNLNLQSSIGIVFIILGIILVNCHSQRSE